MKLKGEKRILKGQVCCCVAVVRDYVVFEREKRAHHAPVGALPKAKWLKLWSEQAHSKAIHDIVALERWLIKAGWTITSDCSSRRDAYMESNRPLADKFGWCAPGAPLGGSIMQGWGISFYGAVIQEADRQGLADSAKAELVNVSLLRDSRYKLDLHYA